MPALFPPTMAVLQLWANCWGRETEIDTTCGYCGHTEYSFRQYQHLSLPASQGRAASMGYSLQLALRVSNNLFALYTAGVPSFPMPSVPRFGQSVGIASTIDYTFSILAYPTFK